MLRRYLIGAATGGPAVADVFISYSNEHRQLTEETAADLDGCGLDVWWDRERVARSPCDGQIREPLRIAECILVLWTEGAAESEWVHIEDGPERRDNYDKAIGHLVRGAPDNDLFVVMDCRWTRKWRSSRC